MSRNDKLRKIADELPPMNKQTADRKFMFDKHGKPVKVDHFKEMLALRDDIRAKGLPKDATYRAETQMMGAYALGVHNAHKKIKRKRLFKRLRAGVTAVLIAFIVFYCCR